MYMPYILNNFIIYVYGCIYKCMYCKAERHFMQYIYIYIYIIMSKIFIWQC